MSDIFAIAVPKWGIEMVEGTLNQWNKSVGDAVAKGDEILEMESDKIINVWDSPIDGVLRRILVEEGETQPVGALLGVIAGADVDDATIDAFIAGFSGDTAQSSEAEKTPAPAPAPAASSANDAATRSSPSVRKLAQELSVDLNTVTGTGRRGRITEDDVRANASGGEDASGDDSVTVTALSATRQTIARRLTQAKQDIPHYYLTVEYELDGLLAHRESLNANSDQRISVNDLLLGCTARALIKEPRVNINLIDNAVHQFSTANLSVAVATDEGLYPVTLRGAENLAPDEISRSMALLAEKAASGKLEKDDLSDGSFTVSNLGMLGVKNFTAIINPPMSAILALGKAEPTPVVRNGELTTATIVSATLSCDHRAIDGAVGAKFLQALGEEIAALG